MNYDISKFLRYSGVLGGLLLVFLPLGFIFALYSDLIGILDFILGGYIYLFIIVFLFLFLGTIGLYRYFRQKNKKIGKLGSTITAIGFLITILVLTIGYTGLQNPFSAQTLFITAYISITIGSILVGISAYKTKPHSKLTPTLFATSTPTSTAIGFFILTQGHGYIPILLLTATLYGISWILISYRTTQKQMIYISF